MVFFNIAYSLEFIVIGLGAFLLSWSWYKETCKNYYRERDERIATAPGFEPGKTTTHCNHRRCGTGLGKSLGTLLIILGIANFGATIYDNVKFKRHIYHVNNTVSQEKWRVLGQNTVVQPGVGNDNTIPQTPAAPGSENSTNTENNSTSGNYTPSDNSVSPNNSGSLPTTPQPNNSTPVTNPNNNNVYPGAPGTPGSQPVPGQPNYQNPQYPQQNNPNQP
jgi:hypothetical protein